MSVSLKHVSVMERLRAPRIAIVVPEIEPWQFYVSLVMECACKVWGGAGFIFIPHSKGKIRPHILKMLKAYDPDHVVTVQTNRANLMEINPDLYPVEVGGKNVSWQEFKSMDPSFQSVLSNSDEIARKIASEACSPFRTFESMDSRGLAEHDESRLLSDGTDHAYSPLDRITNPSVLALSSRLALTRDISVMRASRAGETSGFGTSATKEQPSISELNSVVREMWDLGQHTRDRAEFIWSIGGRWSGSLSGLVPVSRLGSRKRFYIVVGDSIHDLSLAHGLDRLGGKATWIPGSWLSPSSEFYPLLGEILFEISLEQRFQGSPVILVSSSLDVEVVIESVLAVPHPARISGEERNWLEAISIDKIDFTKLGNGFLALARDFDRDIVLPANEDERKSLTFLTPIPAILPETPEVISDRLKEWVVDLEVSVSQMPRGRGLRGEYLEVEPPFARERLRSGRDGISLMSRSFGFVSSSSTARQSLARPRLRTLGLMDWVTAIAEARGWTATMSDAGRKAQAAVTLWGNREDLADDLSIFGPFFSDFQTYGIKKTTDRYLCGDGAVVGNEGFLTFDAAIRTIGNAAESDSVVRANLDRLAELNVLRRGLILQCSTCQQTQWLAIDSLNLSTACSRCQARLPVTRETWKTPLNEPQWFYDLHPVIRQLIAQNGDVSILSGRMQQLEMKNGEAISEMEFRKAGYPIMEIDLIFGTPTSILVGECKTLPDIPTSQRKKKIHALVTIAEMLGADEVRLAAGGPGVWSADLVSNLQTKLGESAAAMGQVPVVTQRTDVRDVRWKVPNFPTKKDPLPTSEPGGVVDYSI